MRERILENKGLVYGIIWYYVGGEGIDRVYGLGVLFFFFWSLDVGLEKR